MAAVAYANDETIETARLLALLLDAGRTTVANNQSLINDPSKGYKGFTPEVFEQQLMARFKEKSGIDLINLDQAQLPSPAKPLLHRLIEESKKTIQSYQPAINIEGIKYKGLIPATFGTETASRFTAWSGIVLKQTAPERLIRNTKNKPDQTESALLQQLGSSPPPPNGILSTREGDRVQVMLPLFYEKACLACHGDPKGERDITGYPKEGAKEGDLGGAISVKITQLNGNR